MKMSELKAKNPNWFTLENKRFFNDVSYCLLHSEGKPYLVRSTFMWSDMCGQPKRLVWRVNEIEENGKIGDLINQVFKTKEEVKLWLK